MKVKELIEILEHIADDVEIKMVDWAGRGSKNTYSFQSDCKPIFDIETRTMWFSVNPDGNRQAQPPREAHDEWGY